MLCEELQIKYDFCYAVKSGKDTLGEVKSYLESKDHNMTGDRFAGLILQLLDDGLIELDRDWKLKTNA